LSENITHSSLTFFSEQLPNSASFSFAMLRTLFLLLVLVHALIHLLGFVKEWKLASVSQLTGKTIIPITGTLPKTFGALWLLACLVLMAAAWIAGFAGVLLSQFLIIIYWPDAKAGALANRAVQYFATGKPGFIWNARVDMMPLLTLAGRDKYADGKGNMLIKVLGIMPIVDATGPETDQGAMHRYLGEMIWFPSAALEPYITWEPIDAVSAKATMSYGGVRFYLRRGRAHAFLQRAAIHGRRRGKYAGKLVHARI
jgi:hypothetical protein